jgi:hypothetical protein
MKQSDLGKSLDPTPQAANVAWRAGITTNRVVAPARQAENRFLGSLIGLQIRAQATYAGEINSLE